VSDVLRTEDLFYTLSWTNPNDHLFDVTLRFVSPEDDPLLWLPAWRPGRYLVQNFAANVREWSANLRKVGKSSWRAAARAGEEITVSYRYYAGVLDAGSSFLDDEEAYFNGSNLFLCVDLLRNEPADLTVAAPADWRIETQLPRDADGVFHARDYDHLIDSPVIAAAAMTRHSFVESGARFHLVVRNDDGLDFEQYLEPLRGIVRAHARLFGGLPLDEYKFLVHVGEQWHGVEHEVSSSIIAKRSALQDEDDHFLSLCSHELFHLWNGKRIVPAAFVPYDYLRETPTRLLWAVEGFTSYYGDLALVRAGLWDETRWLEHLREEIETLENAAGRHHLSLAQASFDAWLQDPAQMHDKTNAWVSFYNKGEIVAALLDLTIRSATEHSLDDVMRLIWRESRVLQEDAIERAVAAVAGAELARDFFARYVDGTEPLPYEELLGRAAVAFDSASGERLALGAKLKTIDGLLMIESVTRDGSAMEAGLLPGDELIAIDGSRTTNDDDVERVFESLSEGEAVPAVITRAGVLQTRAMLPRRDPHVSIKVGAGLSPPHLREAWLRRDE
jgi:predicted metalloprotease with PDZ domain